MNALAKALVVAGLHLALVLSLGGKLLYDRASRPRIWVRTGSVDPDLPIRGRYFTLSLEVQAPDFKGFSPNDYAPQFVRLSVENGKLVAHPSPRGTGLYLAQWGRRGPAQAAPDTYFLNPGVTFFIAEHAETPHLNRGDELWAEVTIPRKGPPRPIQLAIKRGSEWRPLTYR
ncbi:MAG TPA: hypothetical protein VFL42_08225 [Terriglobales bacterium]|nr:hypothetical protein [Terriglobales bacterium]